MLSISQTEILNRFYFDNPWWKTSEIEKRYQNYPKRFYFDSFYDLVKQLSINRAVVLMGPRRVGKTVMIYHAVERLLSEGISPTNILYLSIDTPIYTDLALEKIVNIFQAEFEHGRDAELFIIFDEIQYLSEWEVHLKSLVDSYPSYKFVATGSAAAALKLKSRESGAGRFTDFLLPPLTFAEYIYFISADAKDINKLNSEFINYLNYGGYPEAVFSSLIRYDSSRYIKSDIIDKVLLRDLPSLYGISDVQELNKLFTTIAYNTGNEITLESLAKSSGVSKNTIKKYIEYLEAAFLIKVVNRIDLTSRRFKRATSFKVYLTNPSIRAALFGPISADHEAMGSLTETAIFSQWFDSQNIDNLHYARWKSGEVDIVCLNKAEQKPVWCVEVKWSDLPYSDSRKLKSLIEYTKKNNLNNALVTTKTIYEERIIDDITVKFQPSAVYTYELGKLKQTNQ
jgi:predicted AAA+ superfamily ATPase